MSDNRHDRAWNDPPLIQFHEMQQNPHQRAHHMRREFMRTFVMPQTQTNDGVHGTHTQPHHNSIAPQIPPLNTPMVHPNQPPMVHPNPPPMVHPNPPPMVHPNPPPMVHPNPPPMAHPNPPPMAHPNQPPMAPPIAHQNPPLIQGVNNPGNINMNMNYIYRDNAYVRNQRYPNVFQRVQPPVPPNIMNHLIYQQIPPPQIQFNFLQFPDVNHIHPRIVNENAENHIELSDDVPYERIANDFIAQFEVLIGKCNDIPQELSSQIPDAITNIRYANPDDSIKKLLWRLTNAIKSNNREIASVEGSSLSLATDANLNQAFVVVVKVVSLAMDNDTPNQTE